MYAVFVAVCIKIQRLISDRNQFFRPSSSIFLFDPPQLCTRPDRRERLHRHDQQYKKQEDLAGRFQDLFRFISPVIACTAVQSILINK